MGRVHLFADESGNLDFSPAGSRYFILTTIAVDGFALGDALLNLRRELSWEGVDLTGPFHATEDAQVVRDRVFAVIREFELRIDATIFEKAKTNARLRSEEVWFYEETWHQHLKFVAPQVLVQQEELFVVSATLGTRGKRAQFRQAVQDAVAARSEGRIAKTVAWDASCEPCLQAADYCCWAIQRKWERGDHRSYDLISDKIESELDVFRRGRKRYY